MAARSLNKQLLRFAVVGVASNAVLYVAYLALTAVGIWQKLAMSMVYLAGVLQTFAVNRTWTFSATGSASIRFARYCLSYAIGYLASLGNFYVMVDIFRYPHQVVQAFGVLGVAVLLFVLQKYWVFRPNSTSPSGSRS